MEPVYNVNNTGIPVVTDYAVQYALWWDREDRKRKRATDPLYTRAKESGLKYCMDGYEEAMFFESVPHFQFGAIQVEYRGFLVAECNNPSYFRPIAKAEATESECIPKAMTKFKTYSKMFLSMSS